MRQFVIAFILAAVLLVSGCQTVPESGEGKAGGAETPAEKTGPEKVQVKKTIYVPNVIRETSFYSDGFVESYKTFTYDEQMNVVREDFFDSFDQIIESVVYEGAGSAAVNRMMYNSRGVLQASRTIENNEAGEPVSVSSLDAEGNLQTVSSYEYDADGNKLKWTIADEAGVVLSETVYIYEEGLLVRIDLFDEGGNKQEYFSLEYDGEKLTRREHFSEDGELKSAVEYDYEGSAPVVERHLRANGSVFRTVKFENDERGNPVKEEYFDGNGTLKDWLEREYEYTAEEILVWE